MINARLFRVLVLVLLMCLSNHTEAQENAIVTGRILNYSGENAVLYNLTDKKEEQKFRISPDGSFRIVDCRKPTLYSIGGDFMPVSLFAEPGMKADLQITLVDAQQEDGQQKEARVVYSGDHKDCFDYLQCASGHLLDAAISEWGWERLNTVTFAAYREGLREGVDREFAELQKVKSQSFRHMMTADIEKTYVSYLFRFFRSKGKQDDVFFAWINSLDRNNTDRMYIARNYLQWYEGTSRSKYDPSFGGYLKMIDDVFFNQDLKNYFATEKALFLMKDIKVTDKDGLLKEYEAYCTDAEKKKEVHETYNHYKSVTVDKPIVHFTMEDTKGKKYSIEDFRGKYVYIDSWATWCKPCIAEIPYLKKLYEHYRNDKRIEIISISIDSDRQRWLRKLAADKPQWKQFILPENFNNPLVTEYGRNQSLGLKFIDPKGNIIAIDAPVPSSENIIEWLESHMK